MTNKQRVKILRDLRKMVDSDEDFGVECSDFEEECFSCQAHKAVTVLEAMYEDILLSDYEQKK